MCNYFSYYLQCFTNIWGMNSYPHLEMKNLNSSKKSDVLLVILMANVLARFDFITVCLGKSCSLIIYMDYNFTRLTIYHFSLGVLNFYSHLKTIYYLNFGINSYSNTYCIRNSLVGLQSWLKNKLSFPAGSHMDT